jgi:hypothetical protein
MIVMSELFSKHGFRAGHSKAFLLVLIVAVASVTGVYAYFKLLPAGAGPRTTITSPPLEFSIQLEKASFQGYENITIRFSLTNIGNETIKIAKSYIDSITGFLSTESYKASSPDWDIQSDDETFHFGFSIIDANGTLVYQRIRGWTPTVYNISIEPGGYVKQAFTWNYYIFSSSPLPKGTYQITGVFSAAVNGSWITLEAPSIAFVID